jgi:hypothetical protein
LQSLSPKLKDAESVASLFSVNDQSIIDQVAGAFPFETLQKKGGSLDAEFFFLDQAAASLCIYLKPTFSNLHFEIVLYQLSSKACLEVSPLIQAIAALTLIPLSFLFSLTLRTCMLSLRAWLLAILMSHRVLF